MIFLRILKTTMLGTQLLFMPRYRMSASWTSRPSGWRLLQCTTELLLVAVNVQALLFRFWASQHEDASMLSIRVVHRLLSFPHLLVGRSIPIVLEGRKMSLR
jgi:hypothetical protein